MDGWRVPMSIGKTCPRASPHSTSSTPTIGTNCILWYYLSMEKKLTDWVKFDRYGNPHDTVQRFAPRPNLCASTLTVSTMSSSSDGPVGDHPSSLRARWESCCALVPQRTPAWGDRISASSWLICFTAGESTRPSPWADCAIRWEILAKF